MGGLRIFGPNGRDEAYTPGGDPSDKKRAPGGGGNRSKGGGETTLGRGVGNFGVKAGSEGEEWEQEEGEERRAPLRVGEVLSDRKMALEAIEVREFFGAWNFFGKQAKLENGLEVRKVRVEKAKARVVVEEEKVAGKEKRTGGGYGADCCAQGGGSAEGKEEAGGGAKVPRVEELNSYVESASEVGVSVEEGKRRKACSLWASSLLETSTWKGSSRCYAICRSKTGISAREVWGRVVK